MTSWGLVLFVGFFALGMTRNLANRTAHVLLLLFISVVLFGVAARQHSF